ncbi:MAG: hypothetical protein ACKOPN_00830, partial [Prochlorococcaceae cyanobacterium]
MAATRLNDSQKRELVERFRGGETASDLAVVFGVSANTALRAIKAALDPHDYEQIKRQQQRGRRSSGAAAATQETVSNGPEPMQLEAPLAITNPAQPNDEEQRGVLAIEDADDFGDDGDDEINDEIDDEDIYAEGPEAFVPVVPLLHIDDHAVCEPRPLCEATLPSSGYMLVDKTVELQAQPLRDLPELGRLSEAELERQALVVFANPRQAKQLCGRSQRVIKLPDPRVLERTAPYLLDKGISRVVLEGALY